MKPILEIKDLSKKYRIHGNVQPYLSLREAFFSFLKPSAKKEDFWALKDINFTVNPGDSVGIIGKNGAGKSTLLKVLSKITPPTSGSIISRGRIASLLEVGTGFHLELSGRENIFMNGSILGMKRADIVKKFDEIVDFAGVQKFIDTPLKHYSSGMQLRLAFAVAAFLEPEILIIDEVLAVGDAEFQKKCLGKMKDVSANEGRTVLFVSHNMGAISQLCSKSIFLSQGQLLLSDSTEKVIQTYLKNNEATTSIIKKEVHKDENHFVHVFMGNDDKLPTNEYGYNDNIYINVTMHLTELNKNFELAMRLIDRNKNPVFTIHERLDKYYKNDNLIELVIKIPAGFLTPNSFSWVICINNPGITNYDLQDDVLDFSIIETGSDFARYTGSNYGNVFANYEILNIETK